jgi:multidrug efflux pump subunit AcrB
MGIFNRLFGSKSNPGNQTPDIKEHEVKAGTTVHRGAPAKPLNDAITAKLIENFKQAPAVSEVYQYGQVANDEFSIVLGIKLSANSEEAKSAAINAVQNVLSAEPIDQLLDIYFIESDGEYEFIKGIENSLLYKR